MTKLEQLEKWLKDQISFKDDDELSLSQRGMDNAYLNVLQKITELKADEGEWISVDERLPEMDKRYFVLIDGWKAETLFFNPVTKSFRGTHNVTHWMDIPKLPFY